MKKATANLLRQAVENNARWCDAVCRSHGAPGEFLPRVWINPAETPRFYPNAITLAEPDARANQLRAIEALTREGLPSGWGVKDSYAALDLSRLGFHVLFEAEWIALPSPAAAPRSMAPGWRRIMAPAELEAWEKAWAGDPTEPALPRVFLPRLLEDPSLAFFGAWSQDGLIAGGIACRAGGVVGLSNVFTTGPDPAALRAGCIAAAARTFPELPLVGYVHAPELPDWRQLGFSPIGPLRVWVRE